MGLERSLRTPLLPDSSLTVESPIRTSTPTDLAEVTTRLWLVEPSLTCVSSTRWLTRPDPPPSTSLPEKRWPSSTLPRSTWKLELTLLSSPVKSTDPDPPETGLLRAPTSRVSRSSSLRATSVSTEVTSLVWASCPSNSRKARTLIPSASLAPSNSTLTSTEETSPSDRTSRSPPTVENLSLSCAELTPTPRSPTSRMAVSCTTCSASLCEYLNSSVKQFPTY